ncbi:MAG: hypothetical protein AB8B55_15990, partial [Mariniblastus sp.]
NEDCFTWTLCIHHTLHQEKTINARFYVTVIGPVNQGSNRMHELVCSKKLAGNQQRCCHFRLVESREIFEEA